MLIFKKFNHVSVIRTYGILLKWDFLVLKLCYVCSYKLLRHDKRFNVRANIRQRMSEFYTQTIILIKSHLRCDTMVI